MVVLTLSFCLLLLRLFCLPLVSASSLVVLGGPALQGRLDQRPGSCRVKYSNIVSHYMEEEKRPADENLAAAVTVMTRLLIEMLSI